MSVMSAQMTSLTIVYSTVYSGVDQENIKAPCDWPFSGEFTGDCKYLSSYNFNWTLLVEDIPKDPTMICGHKQNIDRANKFMIKEQEHYVLKSEPISI